MSGRIAERDTTANRLDSANPAEPKQETTPQSTKAQEGGFGKTLSMAMSPTARVPKLDALAIGYVLSKLNTLELGRDDLSKRCIIRYSSSA